MINRRWFLDENIEGGAGHYPRFDCFVERVFIDQTAPSAVDHAHSFFHFGKGVLADHGASFSSQWRMHGEKVGPPQNLVEWDHLNAQITRLVRGDEGIE